MNTTAIPATDKQVAFITNLAAEREMADGTRTGIEAVLARGMDKREASDMITWLLNLPKAARPAAPVAPVEEGMYRTADGTIYKVQLAVHGSGAPYAKRLVETDEGRCPGHLRADDPSAFDAPMEYHNSAETCDRWVPGAWSFVYAPGAVRRLAPADRMTLEQAKEFGALYGTCCVCGRTLTNEESIDAGIGPVCAGKF